ncbi:hypothetical protein [Sphingobacterium sp. SYP-B4668]|uniref:hypothetical protein n=1 Tax=Sphingobacterium sp. SYP-B4668 TaxID=2996035 RepID=UPI0005327598|nr:hypothetical protein [Sphingobacterium sp. SYP-B4668]
MKIIKGVLVALVLVSLFGSCKGKKLVETGINTQTTRIDGKLKRSEYTILSGNTAYTVENKKEYKKYTLDQLKNVAVMMAEKAAIEKGADGILNPTYTVDQKGKKYTVTARVKAYKIKSDDEYIDMDSQLKSNDNN